MTDSIPFRVQPMLATLIQRPIHKAGWVYEEKVVQCAQEFSPSDPVRLEPRGGGGTDFRPAFDWVSENNIAPVCLIYLTDLCCHSHPEAPEYPGLWVTDSRRTALFGESLRFSLE